MDLKFESFHETERDVVVLTPDNEVKYSRVPHKHHTASEPYKKKYKQRKSAIKKFLEIVNRLLEEDE